MSLQLETKDSYICKLIIPNKHVLLVFSKWMTPNYYTKEWIVSQRYPLIKWFFRVPGICNSSLIFTIRLFCILARRALDIGIVSHIKRSLELGT